MTSTSAKLHMLGYRDMRTYLVATLFITGNLILPQLCHLIPQGGMIFLPIYFFTLIGAYTYGWKVGLLTAIFSPTINSMLFGMPALEMVPVIEVKSIILALAAGYAASRFNRITLPLILGVIATAQVLGGVFEWAYTSSLAAALQDFRIGIPGIALQVVGGFFLIRYLAFKY